MKKIVIAGPFNAAMKKALEEALPAGAYRLQYIESEAEYAAFEDADAIILRTLSIGGGDMEKMKQAKLIQRWGAGFDTVDIAAAGKRGIQVAVTHGMNAVPVAEMALALALAVYRNIVPMTEGIMAGRWERDEYNKRSYTINGKTVGVYGIGSIGKKVAALYNAFGATVLYYDPYRLTEEQEKQASVTYVEPDALFERSDILTLHAPLTEETKGCVNAGVLKTMKPNAVLINTARQELVDMEAVAAALREGRLLGAGFDAIESDITANNPFAGLNNVALTAHLGGNTVDNAVHMAKRCGEQIAKVLNGERLAAPHLVNGQFLSSEG